MVTKDGISKYLRQDVSILVYDELVSTNLTARELADEITGDALIVAHRQTGGRGRMGRSFFSPSGGLYMSLLLHLTMPADKATGLTAAAAVATARAIDRVSGKTSEIKWVNDIYLNRRKVCGILAEAQIKDDGYMKYAIVGVGVNLTVPQDGFPADIADRAGAVFDDVMPQAADNRIAAEIVNELLSLCRGGLVISDYLDEYRRRSNIIGRDVDVMRIVGGETRPAKAVAIDDICRLVVRYPDGVVEALGSGDVSVRGR